MRVHDKLLVVRNFWYPRDQKAKARFAVFLGTYNSLAIMAPCTTYPERTGRIPPGSVLVTHQSTAYKGSGFTAREVAVSFRDACRCPVHSKYFKGTEPVGWLNLEDDYKLRERFNLLAQDYEAIEMPVYSD